MTISERLDRIFQLLKEADAGMLEKVEALLERGNSSNISKAQKRELDKQEKLYKTGAGKTYSWEEIKQELIDKHGLQD